MTQIIYYLLRHTQNPFLLRCLNKLGNILIPLFFRITPPDFININSNIIISLTSFPRRIGKAHLVVQSLLRQSVRPTCVILYLSKMQFGNSIEEANLPKSLLRLQQYGLRIKLVEGDLKSYKKFQYAFSEYPNKMVVTVDDDIIYNSDLIANLLKHKTDSNVTANLTRRIAKDNEGALLPYSYWKIDSNADNDHIVIGAGGVMYTPAKMYKDTLREDLYLKLAPKADDMWLSAMARLNGLKIRPTGYQNKFIAISIPGNETLYSGNAEGNNAQVEAIKSYYLSKIHKSPF